MCSSSRMEEVTQGMPKWLMAFSPHSSARRVNNGSLSNHEEQREQSRIFQWVGVFPVSQTWQKPTERMWRTGWVLEESTRNPFPALEKGRAGTGAAVTWVKKPGGENSPTWIHGNFWKQITKQSFLLCMGNNEEISGGQEWFARNKSCPARLISSPDK